MGQIFVLWLCQIYHCGLLNNDYTLLQYLKSRIEARVSLNAEMRKQSLAKTVTAVELLETLGR